MLTMEGSAGALNVVALLFSLMAIGVSGYFALRQVRAAHASNSMSVLMAAYEAVRSDRYRQQEQLLWDELPKLTEVPRYSELPEPLRTAAYDICNFYQMFAYLIAERIIDERVPTLIFYYRLDKTWTSLKPHIDQERAYRGPDKPFLEILEALVERIRSADVMKLMTEFRRRLQ